jgi:ATP-dependent Clp protease ATP-binding subunit ClpA
MSTAVAIKLIDLASKARAKKLSSVSGRDTELSRLARLLLRPKRSHVVIIGEPGSGKTSLTEALALSLHEGKHAPLTEKMYRLDTTPIMSLLINGDSLRQCLQVLTQATTQLTQAIIIIEDIQLLAADDPARLELTLALIGALASHDGIKIITTTTPAAYRRIFQSDYSFNRLFDVLELTQPTPEAAILMVEQGVVELERHHHQRVSTEAVASSVEFGGRFTHGRALPDTALRLIEEACAMTSIAGESVVTAQTIKQVVAEREKLPVSGLDPSSRSNLTGLEDALQRSVVGQSTAIRTIARTIAKAQLGFGDDTKPRGSFLMLGPSGVGKTETAKAIAATYYSGPKALVRLDMSEYAEAHAAVRLIGSPPGYVGYE